MDQETVGNVVLLAIVTLISVIQNGKGSPSLGGEHRADFICWLFVIQAYTVLCVCMRARTHFCLICMCFFLFDCLGCVHFCMSLEFSLSWPFFHLRGDD